MAEPSCVHVKVDVLAIDPANYAGKLVCVSGFLGQMVPYGEEEAGLYGTRDQALSRRAPAYLHIGIRLTVDLQTQLARRSGEQAVAIGTFDFDRAAGRKQVRPSHRPAFLRVP